MYINLDSGKGKTKTYMCYCAIVSFKVEEKNALKITAVNLTKMNLNETVEQEILNGDYSFIYLVSRRNECTYLTCRS